MHENLLAVVEADEGIHQFHDLGAHRKIEALSADLTDHDLYGSILLLLDAVSGVLQDEEKFLAVLEEMIEALNDAVDGPDALIKKGHFLHKDLGVGRVPEADAHQAHHDMGDDVEFLRLVTLLEIRTLDFSSSLLNEDAAELDESVDGSHLGEQLLVEDGDFAGNLGLHG